MSGGSHVIVVDDEAAAREMVGDYLKVHGFRVTLCDGGAALRQAIAAEAPDLIVLDLNMPAEDGLSIVRDLKSRPRVDVLVLAATVAPNDQLVGLRPGADASLAQASELLEPQPGVRFVLPRTSAAPGGA